VAEHQEERSGKLDSEYLGESLRVSERDRGRMDWTEGWPVHREVPMRGKPEERPSPREMPKSKGAEGVGVPYAHPQSGEAQEDLLDDG
jgi:hypothetical protein